MSPWHTDTDSSGSEAPTRIVIVLARLLDGLDAIRCERERSLEIVTKAARDSVPALRLAVLLTLDAEDDLDANAIADAVRHPASTTRRACEDLTAHGLLNRHRGEHEKDPHRWSLTPFAVGGSTLSHLSITTCSDTSETPTAASWTSKAA